MMQNFSFTLDLLGAASLLKDSGPIKKQRLLTIKKIDKNGTFCILANFLDPSIQDIIQRQFWYFLGL